MRLMMTLPSVHVLLFLAFLKCSVGWKQVSSCPVVAATGAAAGVDALGVVVVVCGPNTQIYTISSDQWTSKTSRPVTAVRPSMVAAGSSVYVCAGSPPAGWTPAKSDFHRFSLTADTWATLDPIPTARSAFCGASDGTTLFQATGWDWTQIMSLEAYSIATDAWMTKAGVPGPSRDQTGCALSNGYMSVFGSWDQPNGAKLVHVYEIAADSWTTLAALPAHHYDGVMGSANGYILVVDKTPSDKVAHLYETPLVAAVAGDPLFSTFGGNQVHLDLHPGVFNIFSSPSFVINALVDSVDALPVEENMVIIVIGVIVRVRGALVQITCSVVETQLDCKGSTASEDVNEEVLKDVQGRIEHNVEANTVRFRLPCADLKVIGRVIHTVNCGTCVDSTSVASYIDLRLQADRSRDLCVPSVHASGLLCDLDTHGTSSVAERLAMGWYQSDSGIFSLDVPSAVCFRSQ